MDTASKYTVCVRDVRNADKCFGHVAEVIEMRERVLPGSGGLKLIPGERILYVTDLVPCGMQHIAMERAETWVAARGACEGG